MLDDGNSHDHLFSCTGTAKALDRRLGFSMMEKACPGACM